MDTFVTIIWVLLLGLLPGLATIALFDIADYLRDIAQVLRNPSWHLSVQEELVNKEEDDGE